MKRFIVYEVAECRLANYVEAENADQARKIVIDWWEIVWCVLDEVIESVQVDEADEYDWMLPSELQG